MSPCSITCAFDAGNIEVVDATDLSDIQLKIRGDPGSEGDRDDRGLMHYQWFFFRVSGDIKG